MMKLKHTLSLLALAVCAAASSSALAQTGTIDIKGNIASSGCVPSLSGSVTGTTVKLNTVAIAALPGNVGVGEVPFTFDFTGCDVIPSTTQVWVHFAGSNVDTASGSAGYIIPTTGSSNVRFRLKDGMGGSVILAGGAAPSGGAPGANQGTSVGFTGVNPSMEAHKTYAIEYWSAAALTASDAGAVKSAVTYTVVFD